jgi:hypothetical protein
MKKKFRACGQFEGHIVTLSFIDVASTTYFDPRISIRPVLSRNSNNVLNSVIHFSETWVNLVWILTQVVKTFEFGKDTPWCFRPSVVTQIVWGVLWCRGLLLCVRSMCSTW